MAPTNKDAPADVPADEAPLTVGDLVQLHDDAYALVVAAADADKPARVLRLGHAQEYELAARRVLS